MNHHTEEIHRFEALDLFYRGLDSTSLIKRVILGNKTSAKLDELSFSSFCLYRSTDIDKIREE